MSCLGPVIADLADGRLSRSEADAALAHVAGCDGCRRELQRQRAAHQLLADGHAPPISSDFLEQLRAIAQSPAPQPQVAATSIAAGVVGAARTRRGPRRPGGRRLDTGPRGRRRILVGTVLTGAAAALVVTFGAAPAFITPLTPISPVGGGAVAVVPAVDRFDAAHAASIDQLPLRGPSAEVQQVGFLRPASSSAPPASSSPVTRPGSPTP